MSEPARKPGPESYTQRDMPEIVKLAGKIKQTKSYAVKTANGGSYIDGVPMLEWGQWRDNTYIGCIAAVMEVLGAPVSYETLMGVSGLCYRFAMKPDWCPSATMAQVGTVWDDQINALIGYKMYSIKSDGKRDKQVRANLAAGRPVLGVGLTDEPDWHMLTGYSENAFFGRSYFDTQLTNPASRYYNPERNIFHTENNYRRAVQYPGEYPQDLLRFFDKPCEKAQLRALLKKSLEICLAYSTHKPTYGAVFGEAALRVLMEGFGKSDGEWAESRRNENYHVGCLADARRAAYVYLRESAALLRGANREKLLGVAEAYRSIADELLAVLPYAMLNEAFAFNGSSAEPWSGDIRLGLAAALRKAIDTEKIIQGCVKEILDHWEDA